MDKKLALKKLSDIINTLDFIRDDIEDDNFTNASFSFMDVVDNLSKIES